MCTTLPKMSVLVSALLLGACTGGERMSRIITGPTILAIQANPASAVRGEKLHLEALVASTREGNPGIELTWFVCPMEFEACSTADLAEMTVIGTGTSTRTTVPSNVLAGDTLLYWVDMRKNGKLVDRAIKGVYVRPESEPENHNPRLDRVRWGGETPLASTVVDRRVRVRIASSQMLNEVWLEAGEPASEDVQVRTYTTAGALLDPSGSGASGELYFTSPAKGRIGTWVVVHDQRGGVDWFEHWITVEKASTSSSLEESE